MRRVTNSRTHHRFGHASRNGHTPAATRAEALAVALLTQLLRRLAPSLRLMVLPSRRAAEQRERERLRRRRVALATTGVAVAAALAAAGFLARR